MPVNQDVRNRNTSPPKHEPARSKPDPGRHEAIGNYFAPDYQVHITGQDARGGPALVRSVLELYRGEFPDLHVEIQFFLDSSDTVAWQRTMRGQQGQVSN